MEVEKVKITIDCEPTHTIPAEFIAMPFGRGAPIGLTADGTLYTGFSTESPGLESALLKSVDGDKTWEEKRLDWWDFFAQRLPLNALHFHFWNYRWAMRNGSA